MASGMTYTMTETTALSTAEYYGKALCELGAEHPEVVALTADLGKSTKIGMFGEKFPDRFFNVGIAEQNMFGVAAGLAQNGLIPFASTFAIFASARSLDQVHTDICYQNVPVKIIATHAGTSFGQAGSTHHALIDMACMRSLPHMTVICPCDANETRLMTKAMAEYDGPCFMRLGRLDVEQCTNLLPNYEFRWGKASRLHEGSDVTIIATGLMVQEALKARELLAQEGISAAVLDMHTIKPLDEEAVLKAAEKTGCIVTAEEANVLGGLGGAVAEVVSEHRPVPVIRVGVKDIFGRSGDPYALLERYGLTAKDVAGAAKRAVSMKK